MIPRLLGEGIPPVPGLAEIAAPTLESCATYPTGIVMLRYAVESVG